MLEFLIEAIRTADLDDQIIFGLIICCGTPYALYAYVKNLRRARLIEDIPTSRIRSAAQGFVELEGHGRTLPESRILAPMTGSPCLWWRYIIEKKVSNGKRTRWQVVETKTSTALFMLEDDTGSCLIDPEGAEVHPSIKHSWHGRSHWPTKGPLTSGFSLFSSYRYTEERIPPDTFLYLLGLFRTQRASDGHFDENSEVSALMREWKQDRETLLRRFDINQDGDIDAREWEAARRVALKRVREAQLEKTTATGLHILSRPLDSREFIISTTPQAVISKRHRYKAMAFLAAFLLGCGGLALMLIAFGRISP